MTYTYKLARRLARLRNVPALLLPLLTACAAGEPTGTSSSNDLLDATAEAPVAVSPRTVTLEGTQGVLFRAFESLIPGSAQVTSIEWTATGGTIDPGGTYSSTSTGAFKVVGRRRGNPHNPPDTAVVVVVPPQPALVSIEILPPTATVASGLQQLFGVIGRRSDGTQVSIGVTWTATGGTIDASGLYTAGRTAGTYRVIATHVTTGLADTATVTVPPATLTSITLSPNSVSLSAGQQQQFSPMGRLSDGTTTSSVPVAYKATGGSISVNGYYTAGSVGGTFRVIATAQGGQADTSTVTITASAPPPNSLLYNADLENGGWPAGTTSWQCVQGRIVVYSASAKPAGAPDPRKGTHAASFRVLDTDVSPCTPTENPRATALAENVFHPGDERWQAFSVYFPTTLPTISGGFFMLFEDFGYPYVSSPPVAAYLANNNGQPILNFAGRYDAATKRNQTIASMPVAKGRWYDILVHVKFSTSPTGGFFELWVNGQPITFTNGQTRMVEQTMLTGANAAGMNLQHYRSPGMFPDATIYFDEAKIGTTRAAVDIQSSWTP